MQLCHLRFEQCLPLEAIWRSRSTRSQSPSEVLLELLAAEPCTNFRRVEVPRSAEPTLHQNRSETCFLILSNQPLPLFPPLDFCSISLICSNIGSKSAFLP